MTDVRLRNTLDGGEIRYTNGRVELDDTPESAVYLSLFGGNQRDSGTQADDPQMWWGNRTEQDESRHLRSETQNILQSLPSIPANLRRVEDAMRNDLDWMIREQVASVIEVSATMPAPKRVDLTVDLELASGNRFQFQAPADWPGTQS